MLCSGRIINRTAENVQHAAVDVPLPQFDEPLIHVFRILLRQFFDVCKP